MIAQTTTLPRGMYLFILLLCVPVFIAYNPLPLYFLNDDFIHVPLSQQAVWGQRNSIRPFGDFSLYVDSLLWGNNAIGYHLTNLLIHIGCSVLVFVLSFQVFTLLQLEHRKKFWSLAAALLFFGYAFHAESVFWIIGRTGCLSAFFFLITLIIFLKAWHFWYYTVAAWVAFTCALFTYESVWIMPPLLVLLYAWYKPFRGKRNLVLISGCWLLFAVYLLMRNRWTGELAGTYETGNITASHIPWLVANYAKLVARSFAGPQLNSTVFLTSVAAVIMLMIILTARFTAAKTFSKAWLPWLVAAAFSYLPYVSLGIDTHGVEGERYLYLPSIFVCILICAVLASVKSLRIALAAFAAFFAFNLYFLFREAKAFRWSSLVAKTTMEVLKNSRKKEHFYFENLPRENYGVPIFRLGLEEGVNWLTNDSLAAEKIRIISFNNNDNSYLPQKPSLQYQSLYDRKLSSYYIKSHNSDEYELVNDTVHLKAGDMIILYTNKTITAFR